MDTYHIWVNLAPGAKDLELVRAIQTYLDHLKNAGTVSGYRIQRRKFGFGPELLGEFHVQIDFHKLADLDAAFNIAATRAPDVEELHRAVYSRVVDYKAGLYRDFPDSIRYDA
ncbi:MAG: hypothetical protein KF784_04295 [Fimbriimonadaceae bacterium]|nr:hypothetical protein [Fimbriimonadaceae bacterium]